MRCLCSDVGILLSLFITFVPLFEIFIGIDAGSTPGLCGKYLCIKIWSAALNFNGGLRFFFALMQSQLCRHEKNVIKTLTYYNVAILYNLALTRFGYINPQFFIQLSPLLTAACSPAGRLYSMHATILLKLIFSLADNPITVRKSVALDCGDAF